MCITGLTLVYIKLLSKHWQENLKSIEWYKKNQWKVESLLGIPAVNILAPATEELIFRAPLIIIFSDINGNAWAGILVSAFAFASIHYFGCQIKLFEVLQMKEGNQIKTDDPQTGIKEIEKMQAQQMKIRRLSHVVGTFPLGILAGYYGIKYQSIWISVGIHSAWNLLVPLILPLLVILSILAFSRIIEAWDNFWWKRRRRKQYRSLRY